jgi:Uma2 family endonuclease
MQSVLESQSFPPLVLHFGEFIQRLTSDEFYEFCQQNPDLHLERTSEGDLIIMSPTGGETGRRNFRLSGMFFNWVVANGEGEGFDSSTVFRPPNGAERSPDVAWVRRTRWEAPTTEERKKFPPLCPDFFIELRSATGRLPPLQEKMEEYIANGAQLGWLIDPANKSVWVYRPNADVECLNNSATISGDPELPGFVLPLSKIW